MQRNTALATAVLLSVFLAGGLSGSAGAQQRKNTLTTRASTGRGAATSDQNIKTAKSPNVKARTVAAPVKKGGTRSRGGDVCALHVDNRSDLFVDLYTNGDYRGTISPWGDLEGWVACGRDVFYARADLDNGDYYFWGPSTAYVTGPFVWTIPMPAGR